jgi:hypothetical protein
VGIFEIGRTLNWFDGYFMTCSAHRQLRHLYGYAAKTRGYHSLPRHSERVRKENLIHTIVDYRHHELNRRLLFQVSALALAETSMAIRWMRDGMDESPSEMAQMLTSIVPIPLFELLEVPAAAP